MRGHPREAIRGHLRPPSVVRSAGTRVCCARLSGGAWFTSSVPVWHGRCTPPVTKGRGNMLHWAAVFFVIAIIAAVFGFGGIAASAAGIAKILFIVFLVLAGVSLLLGRRSSFV